MRRPLARAIPPATPGQTDPITDFEREQLAHFQTKRTMIQLQAFNAQLLANANDAEERECKLRIRARIDAEVAEQAASAKKAKAAKRTPKAKEPAPIGNAEVVELQRKASA